MRTLCLVAVSSLTLLHAGDDWELIASGHHLTADSTVDPQGNVYFSDNNHNRIYKVDTAGKVTVWRENSGAAHGVAFGPDGRVYAGQHDRKRVVAFSADGSETIIAEGVQSHHLIVTPDNRVYFSEAPKHTIWLAGRGAPRRVVLDTINWPRAIRLAPRGSLVINDPNTPWVWTFRVAPDGSLIESTPRYRLKMPKDSAESGAGGMAFDPAGFLYVASSLGVQVFDPAGKAITIIPPPPGCPDVNDVLFAGPGFEWMYVTTLDKMYRRKAPKIF